MSLGPQRSALAPQPEESRSARSGPPPLGARITAGGAGFRVYATGVERVQVRIVDDGGAALGEHDLAPRGDDEYEALVPRAGHGTLYYFVLDGRQVPDPFAQALPKGVHGPAQVVESRHHWQHGAGVSRPLRAHVIYELHVGTFTPQGTYAAAATRLPDLAQLGVTAIELMPLAAFAGQRGWGYDGVAHFAPFSPYGTPDQLRAFIDEAHRLQLSVFLDVVYNHFGPAGNYLDAFSRDYFADDVHNAWGRAPDFRRAPMRRYVLDNARMWLREFRFDGLRLDATHAMIDRSPHHILRALADAAAALRPRKLLLAEDDRNDPDLAQHFGIDGIWADDFHHAMRVTLTGEQEGYYAAYRPGTQTLAETIRAGWLYTGQTYPPSGRVRGKPCPALPAESLIYCIQNHDQIGNRALGDRLSDRVGAQAHALAATVLLFLPMTPMLFMGQEWGASTPFQFFTDHAPELGRLISQGRRDEFKSFAMFSQAEWQDRIPDPQALATFERSRLDWDERMQPRHQEMLALYRDLLTLRRQHPVLARADRTALEVHAHRREHGSSGGDGDGDDGRSNFDVLEVRRWTNDGSCWLLANFGPVPVAIRSLDPALEDRPVLFASHAAPDIPRGLLPGQTAIIFG